MPRIRKRRDERLPATEREQAQPEAAGNQRRDLLTLRATQPVAEPMRVKAALHLSHEQGNQFVQRSLPPSVQNEGVQVARQPAVLAREASGDGATKLTVKPLVNKTYTVKGANLEEALSSIRDYADAHDGEAASVEWVPRWSYSLDADGNVKSVTVTVTITMTLPRWPNTWQLSKAAKAEWDRAFAELKKHEAEHAAILREQAKLVGAGVVGLGTSEADELLAQAIADANAANTAIDPFVTTLDTSIE